MGRSYGGGHLFNPPTHRHKRGVFENAHGSPSKIFQKFSSIPQGHPLSFSFMPFQKNFPKNFSYIFQKGHRFLSNKNIDITFEISDYINVDNNFFNIFEKHLSSMHILMGENGSITFQNKLKNTMLNVFKRTFSLASINLNKIEKDLLFNFQSASFISIINYWTEHPELTVKELFPFYNRIISNGIVNFVKDNMQ